MGINDVVSRIANETRDLDEKLRSGQMTGRDLTRRDFLRRGLIAFIAANYPIRRSNANTTPGGIILPPGAEMDNSILEAGGKTYYTTPGERFSITQDAIDNPIYDTIHWTSGTYSKDTGTFSSIDDEYNLKPGKNYTFDKGVIISGLGLEHWRVFAIYNGGPINFSAQNLILENVLDGFFIGLNTYDNINISGVNFTNIHESSIFYQDIEHPSPLTEAAVKVRFCTADSGRKFARFGWGGDATENSPYVGVENCTIRDIIKWGVDMPWYYVKIEGAFGPEYTKVVLGQDDVKYNVWKDSEAMIDPDLHKYIGSPHGNRYVDVNEPFIGNPEDDNKEIDDGAFYENTLYPIMFGGAHLENGDASGAYPLVATWKSVGYFINCWLAQGNPNDPNDPNNDSNYDGRADFKKKGIINFEDFATVAKSFRN